MWRYCCLTSFFSDCRYVPISLQLRHVSTSGKKLVNSNISSTCPHNMVNFGPLAAEIGWWVCGTPANVNGFHILALLLHQCHSVEANQTAWCMAVIWAGTLYIHFRMLLPPNGIHFASKSCILLYWQHYCTTLKQCMSAKLWHSAEGAICIRQGGHHVGHQPTF